MENLINKVNKEAEHKYNYILSKYGTENGERLKPYYLESIKKEMLYRYLNNK